MGEKATAIFHFGMCRSFLALRINPNLQKLLVADQCLDRVMLCLEPFDFNDFSSKLTKYLMFPNNYFCERHSRAIFCKSHPTCDSRVFKICSHFNELKIKVILEYCRNFSSIKRFAESFFFWGGGGAKDNSSFSRNEISLHKPYFGKPLSLIELIFRVQVTST